ncbi:hypothetical protein ACF0H5_006270 [Mactra antiquata]
MSDKVSVNGSCMMSDQVSVNGLCTMSDKVSVNGSCMMSDQVSVNGLRKTSYHVSVNGHCTMSDQVPVNGLCRPSNPRTMPVDQEYLQNFGLGLQNLRATGQFCDAMVHKVVLSAASQKLHDLALDFDMTPHRERDQLEIIIPPDISLYAVNLFIQFLYTGQIDINSRIVGHVERLAALFEVRRLQIQCQDFIQENNPDSQNLENRVEPDSSKNGSSLATRDDPITTGGDDTSQYSNYSRSNSVCSAVSGDTGFNGVVVKTEPAHLASYEASQFSSPGLKVSQQLFSKMKSKSTSGQSDSSMNELEKLMSPVVNLEKLPSTITMDTVVMVSDEELDDVPQDSNLNTIPNKNPSQYSLEEKKAVAVEAKRYGTTHVAQTRNIPLNDILNWMTLFGLRHTGNQRHRGKKFDNQKIDDVDGGLIIKQEIGNSDENFLDSIGEQMVLENVPVNEETLVNEAVKARLGMSADDNLGIDDNVDDFDDDNDDNLIRKDNSNKPQMIQTPWGKRPVIIGQSKAFDAKSERKIVQWVLERQARDGYVFTDDFKNYARSLYKGEKVFGATQAWMKKFLRRHRNLKHVKFCSKFKNVYTTEEKVNSVVLAKRFGVPYAAKHTGINQKVIHCWKLAYEKGMLNVEESALMQIEKLSSSPDASTISSVDNIATNFDTGESSQTLNSSLPEKLPEATRGIVPEFERRIVQNIIEFQNHEGSVNYNDISKISQSIYKETRPNFKASHNWVKSFLNRHKKELVNIDLENVSKVLFEGEPSMDMADDEVQLSKESISEMVDQALKVIGSNETTQESGTKQSKDRRPVVVGPSVTFDRKTEKKLVEWAVERQQADGYVFTDDFKLYAKSVHTGTKVFTASSGWMTLFLRRHRQLKDVVWRSKYKNNYTEEEKMAAVAEAKRLGAGHVGRKLGIEPKLICTWRIKMEKNVPKQQSFWKGTKVRKFGKGLNQPKYAPIKHTSKVESGSDAARGIVPEFEQRIVDLILEDHEREGSISYEDMSKLAQSVYKETRPTFKASYAWIRNFMKRNEDKLPDLNIDNVKKVFQPDDDVNDDFSANTGMSGNDEGDYNLQNIFKKRPIIVGQSRSLDTKTEKKLVQWTVDQQEKNGYVFLDQFKTFAQSLYKGSKKFCATQAWRIKFLRRNHAALKHIKFQSRFRNQYTNEEKKAIVLEAKKFGPAYVAKRTGIEHCLINAWKIKLERSGELTSASPVSGTTGSSASKVSERPNFASKVKEMQDNVGPGLYSARGIVPAIENKIITLIMNKMDEEGSVSYQDVSNISRAVYKETRPNFKASYNWVKDFLKRNKKALRQVEFEQSSKVSTNSDIDMEILIPEDQTGTLDDLIMASEIGDTANANANENENVEESGPMEEMGEMDIVIDNPEDPNYDATEKNDDDFNIEKIVGKRPIIIGKAVHFNRKTEKKIVEWLQQVQNQDGFVFTDDFRRYARSLYTGPPEKFGATNAWITKFLRRNRLEGKIEFQSKLKGCNAKFEEKICELIHEQQIKEGSVSNEDIQRITQSVYKETRPNFRACYGWIRDFLKRNKAQLAGVELENVKKLYIPDEENGDGVIVQNYDPMKAVAFLEPSTSNTPSDNRSISSDHHSLDSSWIDMDSSIESNSSKSQLDQSQTNVLDRMANQKRPIIIGPPRGMDSKTEKKIVQWMLEQQEQDGCVYLDLFKQYAKSIHSGPKHFAATQAWMTKFKQRNHEALKNVIIRSRFRNEYSIEEKLAIVEEAKRLGCNHVGRKLGINGGVIYSWKVQLEQVDKISGSDYTSDIPDTSQQTSARGVVPEFENNIVRMVLETQRAKGSVTYEDVAICARSVYTETRPNFKASNNWVLDFIRRYKKEFQDVTFENQRKALTENEKLQILSEEKKYGTDHVVKKRNISASTLYNWRRNMKAKSIPIPKYKAIVSSKIKKKYAKGKNMKTYTLEEKRNMVAIAEANGITYASLKLGVTRNMIGKWVRYFRDQGENIVINAVHPLTLKKELEQNIVSWVLEQNETLGIVLIGRIKDEAKRVFEEAYTGFNATDHWLEGFLSQHSSKFEKVRFRDEEDHTTNFSDEVKLKISRFSDIHGAVATADLTGLTPKIIYHWRRNMKLKGHDLSSNEMPCETVKVECTSPCDEPKSLMQRKLDSIAEKYDVPTRKALVLEANINGTSVTVKKHKLPLPLLLKWMKVYEKDDDNDDDNESKHSTSRVSDGHWDGKMKIRLPSVEKAAQNVGGNKKHAKGQLKKTIVEECQKFGVKKVSEMRGMPYSTIYNWLKEYRDSSEESSRTPSIDRSLSSVERESTTPIPVQDIKKEPGICEDMEDYSFQSKTQVYCQTKVMRKYTNEEKEEAVNRAAEIGHKQASVELGIPLSNVKRWYDLYQTTKSTVDKRKSKSPVKSSSPSSTVSSPSLHTDTVKERSTSSESSLERKHRLSDIMKHPRLFNKPKLSSPRRMYYTEEEKIQFVKDTEVVGTAQVAEKANVSVDVVYKWRSKYLKAIRHLGNKTKNVSDDDTESRSMSPDVSTRSINMPGPRNPMLDLSSKQYSPKVGACKETESNLSPYLGLHVASNLSDISPRKQANSSGANVDDFSSDSGKPGNNYPDDYFEEMNVDIDHSDSDKTGHVQNVNDLDILAVDHLLDMTTGYMEAEKKLKNDTLGMETDNAKEGENDMTGYDDGDMNMIQIVDVKSEADGQ